jgi:hypothetical protein
MNWSWICRDCKKEYPENGEGLYEGVNPSGLPLKLCACGGVVDLCPTKRAGDVATLSKKGNDGKIS